MSYRVLIEINTDCLDELRDEPERFREVLDNIASAHWPAVENLNGQKGLRCFGVKHHSEDRIVDWK